jgi:hypothetical protein
MGRSAFQGWIVGRRVPPRSRVTVRPWRPTCNVAHRATRVVNAHRAVAISGLSSRQQRPHAAAARVMLAPHQSGRAAEHREIGQHDLADTVAMHDTATRTRRPFAVDRDDDLEPQGPVGDTNHDDVGRSTSSAHMRVASVSKQGLLETRRLQTSLRIAEPPCAAPGIRLRSTRLKRGAPTMACRRPAVRCISDVSIHRVFRCAGRCRTVRRRTRTSC